MQYYNSYSLNCQQQHKKVAHEHYPKKISKIIEKTVIFVYNNISALKNCTVRDTERESGVDTIAFWHYIWDRPGLVVCHF